MENVFKIYMKTRDAEILIVELEKVYNSKKGRKKAKPLYLPKNVYDEINSTSNNNASP
jgi:hypothetical protein